MSFTVTICILFHCFYERAQLTFCLTDACLWTKTSHVKAARLAADLSRGKQTIPCICVVSLHCSGNAVFWQSEIIRKAMLISNCAPCQLLLELKVTPLCLSSLQRSVPGSINWSVASSTDSNYAPPGS